MNYMLNKEGTLTSRIFEEVYNNHEKDNWVKEMKKVAQDTKLDQYNIKETTKKLKIIVNDWDTKKCQVEIYISITLYKRYKNIIKEESIHDHKP